MKSESSLVSRRGFLRLAGAIGATGQLSASEVSLRRPLSETDPEQLVRVYRRFEEMFPAGHPLSLSRTGELHGTVCSGFEDLHNNWNFLPWHRAFIRVHEMALQAANPTEKDFRLPYWDWDKTRAVPDVYTKAKWGGKRNPLFLERDIDAASLSSATSPRALLGMLFAENAEGGCNEAYGLLGGHGSPDTIETGAMALSKPHGSVHTSTGNTMRNSTTAALDPLFYVHHANVDRIWEIWASRNGGHSRIKYPPAWCAAHEHLHFPRPEGSPESEFRTNADLLDTTKLGYRYDMRPLRAEVASGGFCLNVGRNGVEARITSLIHLNPPRLPRANEVGHVFDWLKSLYGRESKPDFLPQLFLSFEGIPVPDSEECYFTFYLEGWLTGKEARLLDCIGFFFGAQQKKRKVSALFTLELNSLPNVLAPFRLYCVPGKFESLPDGQPPANYDRVKASVHYAWAPAD